MASSAYQHALRMGQKEAKACSGRGEDPWLPALEDLVPGLASLNEVDLGLVTVSLEQVTGTKTRSRRNAFSRSFYPLLSDKSEFADKWSSLYSAQTTEGIHDPIKAVEYLNEFYVIEGHKRVSVLRYAGASTIEAQVIRVLPHRSSEPEIVAYYEFLDFYRITRVNYIRFHDVGKYGRLLSYVAGEDRTPWTLDRSRNFSADVTRFRQALRSASLDWDLDEDECLLRYLRIYGYDHLTDRTPDELKSDLATISAELRTETRDKEPSLQMEPEAAPAKSIITRILEPESAAPAKKIITRILTPEAKLLKIAFLHDKDATTSYWTYEHEKGRAYVQELFGDRIRTVSCFNLLEEDGYARICALAEEGYDMIFTTTPRLLDVTLRAAAVYPKVKFLNCSLNISHPLIRTYYGRMYEAKFITGVIAGALSENGRIGYICNYPIYGMPASINAFALGAQMANPSAQVFLEWSTLPYVDIYERFEWNDVTCVSGQDIYAPNDPKQDFGVFLLNRNHRRNIAMSKWHWSRFYEKIIRSVLDGSWDNLNSTVNGGSAINYWWGLASGVIDVEYTYGIPPQTRRLVELLKKSIIDGSFRPFEGPVFDSTGRLRIEQGRELTPAEIIRVDWLASNVVGSIPPADLLTPEAQALVRIQGVLKDEKEKVV